MHTIARINCRVIPRPRINDADWTRRRTHPRSPSRDRVIEISHARITRRAAGGIHRRYLGNKNSHVRILDAHLRDESAVGGEDGRSAETRPDVVGAELHHHDIRLRNGKPAGEVVVAYDTGSEKASMTIVLPIVREATALSWQRANEIGVGYACGLEFLPEESTPAARRAGYAVS